MKRADANANARVAEILLAALSARAQGEAPMTASTVSTTEARNRSLVETAFKAWRDGTGSPYSLLADDVSWTIVGRSDASKTYANSEAFMSEVIRPFNARMREGLRPTIRSLHVDGNTVIIFFDAQGVARDGQPYVNTYAWFWEMRDGRVTKAHAFFDSISFNELWRRVPALEGLRVGHPPVRAATPTRGPAFVFVAVAWTLVQI
jgi:ketosteroid isomerase-like protein